MLAYDSLFHKAMKSFLDEDPSNIVGVHCLAGSIIHAPLFSSLVFLHPRTQGRGRTGTVVSSFLIRLGLFNNADDSLRYFATTRSSTGKEHHYLSRLSHQNVVWPTADLLHVGPGQQEKE